MLAVVSLGFAVAVPAEATTGVAAAGLTAAPTAPQGLTAVPLPPQQIKLKWAAYTDFTPTDYVVTLEPGSRVQIVDGSQTTAIFDDTTWGTRYVAGVTAEGTGGQTSPQATISIPGARLSADLTKNRVLRGKPTTLTGVLLGPGMVPLANKQIVVQVALAPYQPPSWSTIGYTRTSGSGKFRFTSKAHRNAIYRVLYRQRNTAGSWDSNMALRVHVRVTVDKKVRTVAGGRSVAFHGQLVCPPGQVAGATIRLQRKQGGHWVNVTSGTVAGNGTYRLRTTVTGVQRTHWRVFTQAGPSYDKSFSRTV